MPGITVWREQCSVMSQWTVDRGQHYHLDTDEKESQQPLQYEEEGGGEGEEEQEDGGGEGEDDAEEEVEDGQVEEAAGGGLQAEGRAQGQGRLAAPTGKCVIGSAARRCEDLLEEVQAFTKPPIFQRNRLTCSGNPLLKVV